MRSERWIVEQDIIVFDIDAFFVTNSIHNWNCLKFLFVKVLFEVV